MDLRVRLLEDVLAVIDPHLGERAAVGVRLQARQHGEARQHLQRVRARTAPPQGPTAADQLLVDLAALLVTRRQYGTLTTQMRSRKASLLLVVAEGLPLRLVAVGEQDALERDRADILRADR